MPIFRNVWPLIILALVLEVESFEDYLSDGVRILVENPKLKTKIYDCDYNDANYASDDLGNRQRFLVFTCRNTNATSVSDFNPRWYDNGSCSSQVPGYKIAIDATKTSFGASLYLDCNLRTIVKCFKGYFDEDKQQCIAVECTPKPIMISDLTTTKATLASTTETKPASTAPTTVPTTPNSTESSSSSGTTPVATTPSQSSASSTGAPTSTSFQSESTTLASATTTTETTTFTTTLVQTTVLLSSIEYSNVSSNQSETTFSTDLSESMSSTTQNETSTSFSSSLDETTSSSSSTESTSLSTNPPEGTDSSPNSTESTSFTSYSEQTTSISPESSESTTQSVAESTTGIIAQDETVNSRSGSLESTTQSLEIVESLVKTTNVVIETNPTTRMIEELINEENLNFTSIELSTVVSYQHLIASRFIVSLEPCRGAKQIRVLSTSGAETDFVYTKCFDCLQFSLYENSTFENSFHVNSIYYASPCTASNALYKFSLDSTGSSNASMFFYDCPSELIVKCADDEFFDQPSQSCSNRTFDQYETENPGIDRSDPRLDILNSLLNCQNSSGSPFFDSPEENQTCSEFYWFRRADGSCNNLRHSWWGSALTPYKRLAKPAYDDFIEKPRILSTFKHALKNPSMIASIIHSGPDNHKDVTHYLPLFGQYLMYDIIKTGRTFEKKDNQSMLKECQCGSESADCVNMEVPSSEPDSPLCLSQIRERDSREDFKCDLGHREQINEATAWLDQSNTYGNSVQRQKSLRSFKNGRLKTDERNDTGRDFLPNECDVNKDLKLIVENNVCFQTGDERANGNPLLAGIHTIFVREHNRIVDALHEINPSWDDERLFQEGRRINNAIYQNIVYSEWLPSVLGSFFHQIFGLQPLQSSSDEYSNEGYFTKYDSENLPSIAIEMAAAAGRFGHALVRSWMGKANKTYRVTGNLTLANSLFHPELLVEKGGESFDELMRGCLRDLANNNQPFITKDLVERLVVDHGSQNPAGNHSLPALNINRGRETGLSPYNKYRLLLGLKEAKSFGELTWIDADKIEKLEQAYASVDDIDLFSGAMRERKVPGGLVGPTFAQVLARGFRDLKYGDRFYFENSPTVSPHPFTRDQLESIRSVRFSSVLCNTVDFDEIILNVFVRADRKKNPKRPCASLKQLDLNLFKEQELDLSK